MSALSDPPSPPPDSNTKDVELVELTEVDGDEVSTSTLRTDQSANPASSRRQHRQHRSLYARAYASLSPYATYLVAALLIALLSIVVGLKVSPSFASFASDHLDRMASSTVSPSAPPAGATEPVAVASSAPAKVVTTPSVASSAAPSSAAGSAVASSSTTPTASAKPAEKEEEPFQFTGNFKEWNRLADGMDRFHNHFRWEYKNVYDNALGGYAKKRGQNLQRFLREAEQLAHHLDMHHRIEEAYIFPLLAKKMPQFKDGGRDKGAHIKAHKGIHDGLERYQAYINKSKADPDSYDGAQLRKIMDSFHDVLFNHLDEEVKDLGAESVQKAGFTLDELKRFPM